MKQIPQYTIPLSTYLVSYYYDPFMNSNDPLMKYSLKNNEFKLISLRFY